MGLDYDSWVMAGPGGPNDDDGEDCPDCDGSGKRSYFPFTEWTKCEPCDGSGRLPKPERDYDPDPEPIINEK